jgi:hypothetical protein
MSLRRDVCVKGERARKCQTAAKASDDFGRINGLSLALFHCEFENSCRDGFRADTPLKITLPCA